MQAGSTCMNTTSPITQRVPVGAKLDHLMQPALEVDRHLFDARRLDLHARKRREPGFVEFGLLLRETIGGVDHFLPHRLRHYVETELAGLLRVLERMLLAA